MEQAKQQPCKSRCHILVWSIAYLRVVCNIKGKFFLFAHGNFLAFIDLQLSFILPEIKLNEIVLVWSIALAFLFARGNSLEFIDEELSFFLSEIKLHEIVNKATKQEWSLPCCK